MGLFFHIMPKKNFLIYDDNVSLEAFENNNGELSIKTYYNNNVDNYMIANFNEDQITDLIEHLSGLLNNYGNGRMD